MAFIFNGEEDWDDDEYVPLDDQFCLAHTEFDTIEDLYELAHALKVNVNQIRMGGLPDDKLGCAHFYTDGAIDISMNCYSVLVALHEFAHVCRRHERDAHGKPFQKRFIRLIRLAEDYLEDKIVLLEGEPERSETPEDEPVAIPNFETVTTVEPIPDDIPLWQLLDDLKAA